MRFVSTRGDASVGLDEALVKGIADDGGLFVPVDLPTFSVTDFDDGPCAANQSWQHRYPDVVGQFVQPVIAYAVRYESFVISA